MSPLRRLVGLRPRGTRIPDAVSDEVKLRDAGRCVGPLVGMPGGCIGSPQRDHIRASGALGMKSASTVENLVLLCALHHEMKTRDGRRWRLALIAYVDEMHQFRLDGEE
jgi:hypothetical protein